MMNDLNRKVDTNAFHMVVAAMAIVGVLALVSAVAPQWTLAAFWISGSIATFLFLRSGREMTLAERKQEKARS